MKRKVLLSLFISSFFFFTCKSGNRNTSESEKVGNTAVIQLTNDAFKKMVFNYELDKEWKYEGSKPLIIDFYADWCEPCRNLSPIVEEVAKEYEGKIIVYKVDTDKELILSQSLGISGLPTLLFIPAHGSPQMSTGAIPKESLIQAINEVLLVK
jgi:thioredoxin 1